MTYYDILSSLKVCYVMLCYVMLCYVMLCYACCRPTPESASMTYHTAACRCRTSYPFQNMCAECLHVNTSRVTLMSARRDTNHDNVSTETCERW